VNKKMKLFLYLFKNQSLKRVQNLAFNVENCRFYSHSSMLVDVSS